MDLITKSCVKEFVETNNGLNHAWGNYQIMR